MYHISQRLHGRTAHDLLPVPSAQQWEPSSVEWQVRKLESLDGHSTVSAPHTSAHVVPEPLQVSVSG